jgi:hypothetical protein
MGIDAYNPKSCSALEKPYYRPIEAALRWCGLIDHEADILQATGEQLLPPISAFPRWPCLRANAEKILDALQNDEIPRGRDGRTVAANDHVAPARLTIRHADLKAWMARVYPDQKPKFLFDEIERETHTAINADAYLALQADRDALRVRIKNAEEWAKTVQAEKASMRAEIDALRARADGLGEPTKRAETTYLNIIGAMLELLQSSKPGRESAAGIIRELVDNYGDKHGIRKTTLEVKFAEAVRSIRAT